MNTLPMTAAGYSILNLSLKCRIQLDRLRLIEGLQEAIADGSNLAENPELLNQNKRSRRRALPSLKTSLRAPK